MRRVRLRTRERLRARLRVLIGRGGMKLFENIEGEWTDSAGKPTSPARQWCPVNAKRSRSRATQCAEIGVSTQSLLPILPDKAFLGRSVSAQDAEPEPGCSVQSRLAGEGRIEL
ncbi:hypothetical protein RB8457 [Rhodopirellula baltica SH 1]|uniref:Uncharacterized protein n=1 Tax=Rhodopirellula baltica (strain DSM 10527 / NCIMB 13988 / SH1) TaxID=243090 RepID=Q7UFN4_RHOBA|nr:hypothetical protein RB8457 [Rhodopirellula baltica SH 1]